VDVPVQRVVECVTSPAGLPQIRDLFNPTDGVDLKVRNHPKLGFYVQDLTRNAVSNYQQISDVGGCV
jgi:hypothetical protein